MKLIIIATLVIASALCNGICDTLQFHYTNSRYAQMNERFWNPKMSWVNKYKHDEEGNLVKPLQPKFLGSTTWFVFTTDAWHLFKTLDRGLMRTALVILLLHFLGWKRNILVRNIWVRGILLWILITAIQAASFHITYTIL
jgi:hypothetical protein